MEAVDQTQYLKKKYKKTTTTTTFAYLWCALLSRVALNTQNTALNYFTSLVYGEGLSYTLFTRRRLLSELSATLSQPLNSWKTFRSSAGRGWEGAARMFQSLPAHYMPQIAAFLSHSLSNLLCAHSRKHSLGSQPPFPTFPPLQMCWIFLFIYFFFNLHQFDLSAFKVNHMLGGRRRGGSCL